REYPTKLLLHKPKGQDSMEVEHYCVAKALRGKIRGELKSVRVFPYYSTATRRFALWVVNVTPGNHWYESLQELFAQPPEFFRDQEIRIVPDKENDRYRIKHRDRSCDYPRWPERDVGELLGEAIGTAHFIQSADHPLYRDLTSGKEL